MPRRSSPPAPRSRRQVTPVVALALATAALGLAAPAVSAQEQADRVARAAGPDTLPGEPEATPAGKEALPAPDASVPVDVGFVDPAAEAEHGPARGLAQVLEGRVPGVRSAQTSGLLGSSHFLRLRGPTSLLFNSSPVVYVDGVRVDARTETGLVPVSDIHDPTGTSRLAELDPRDLESVRILKGPAAASRYGPGADAGVLLVETRRGRGPGPRVEATVEQGFQRRTGRFADDYLNLTSAVGITDPGDPRIQPWAPLRHPVTGDVFVRFNPLEDPLTEPFRDGRVRSYGAVVRGTAGPLGYYASARQDDDEGVLPGNSLGRTRLRGNVDLRPAGSLDLSVGLGYLGSDARIPANGSDVLAPVINGGLGFPGTAPAAGGNGELCLGTELGAPEGFCDTARGNALFNFDFLSRVPDTEDRERLTAGANLRWRPAAWLGSRVTLGLDRSEGDLFRFVDTEVLEEVGLEPTLGGIDALSSEQRTRTVELAVTAEASPTERLSASTTLGGAYHGASVDFERCRGTGIPAGLEPPEACLSGTSISTAQESREVDRRGAWLSERLGWDGTLFLTASLRADDYAGGDAGTLWSPGLAASAALHRLPFWDLHVVEKLRLRAAWGRSYRERPFRGAVRAPPGAVVPDGEGPGPEETEELEVGLDATLLEGRATVSFTHFRRTSRNLVSPIISPVAGSGELAEIENDGFEAALRARVLEGGAVAWDLDLALDTRDPLVTERPGSLVAVAGNSPGLLVEGYAPGAMFAPVVASAERDADGAIVPASVVLAPGDLEGTSLVHLGSPEPTAGQTLASTLRLPAGLEVFALVDRVAGHVKFDRTSLEEGRNGRLFAWRQVESPPEVQAALEAGGLAAQGLFVEEADFVRWRELSVRWELPEGWTGFLPGPRSGARLILGGRNLHTWTGYPGLDPETRTAGGLPGFTSEDTFTLPPVRSWFARLSVGI